MVRLDSVIALLKMLPKKTIFPLFPFKTSTSQVAGALCEKLKCQISAELVVCISVIGTSC